MADLFNFSYDLLQSFCFVCKNFLLASIINENEVLKYIYIYYSSFNLKTIIEI
jgi:hypothetical protein